MIFSSYVMDIGTVRNEVKTLKHRGSVYMEIFDKTGKPVNMNTNIQSSSSHIEMWVHGRLVHYLIKDDRPVSWSGVYYKVNVKYASGSRDTFYTIDEDKAYNLEETLKDITGKEVDINVTEITPESDSASTSSHDSASTSSHDSASISSHDSMN
jgi:hypothetical protein